jgi:hypothetical protein
MLAGGGGRYRCGQRQAKPEIAAGKVIDEQAA